MLLVCKCDPLKIKEPCQIRSCVFHFSYGMELDECKTSRMKFVETEASRECMNCMKCIDGRPYSAIELAEMFSVSTQQINMIKMRGFKKIKRRYNGRLREKTAAERERENNESILKGKRVYRIKSRREVIENKTCGEIGHNGNMSGS